MVNGTFYRNKSLSLKVLPLEACRRHHTKTSDWPALCGMTDKDEATEL